MNLREYESFILTDRNVEWVEGLFELVLDICVCGFTFFMIVMFFMFAGFAIKFSFDDYKQKKLDERESEIFNLSEIKEIIEKNSK